MDIDYNLPLNLGNPREFTISELANLVLKLTGSKSKIEYLPLPEDDPKQRQPDIRKVKKMIGWQLQVPLEEGLKKTIEYFRERIKDKG